MTTARIAALLILLFCGTMTTLLVRSVYWPEESRLSAVVPQVPVELFLKRSEGADLDIWEANRVTGSLYLSPFGLSTRSGDGVRGGKVRIEATIRLKQPVMGTQLLGLQGSCFFSTEGEVDDLDLNFKLPAQPEIRLTIRQPAGDKWPSIHLEGGGMTLFQSKGGETADTANSYLVNLITSAVGISPEDLISSSAKPTPTIVRSGLITAGGEQFDGFYIAPGGEDSQSFQLYMANTGEILRIETPFSESSELGLRLLSKALRPAGTEVPVLNLYSTAPKKQP